MSATSCLSTLKMSSSSVCPASSVVILTSIVCESKGKSKSESGTYFEQYKQPIRSTTKR